MRSLSAQEGISRPRSLTKRTNLMLVVFFTLLTILLTTFVILTWEKVFLKPVFSMVAARYPGEQERETRQRVQQRIEHFFISITVDVIVVTMLLRLVGRQQRELAASEERYRALFEHASDGIGLMTVEDHRLLEVNKKFCDIFGCEPQEMIGKNAEELARTAAHDSLSSALPELLMSDVPRESELTLHPSSGPPLPVSVSSSTLSMGDESLLILLVRDLSVRKRLEAEKEEIQRQLFQSSKLASIGELSAGVAHEINNPLNGIINYAELLKDDGIARTDEQQHMLDGIIDEGQRIAMIVRNLLTFARRDAKELTRVSVADAINTSLVLFRYQLQKEGISVELDIPAELPPVRAESSRLRQVVVNMISNAHHALRARQGDGPKLFRITARAAERAGKQVVLLEFYDNGTGVAPAHRDKLFDPFFTTRRDGGGTGLGLSLSFGIVKVFGGTISVESEEGVFTRFTVELPVMEAQERHYADGVAGGR
jgi:PAS domain S-box-containing protein